MALDDPLRVCFVCSGNICRSPMAEVVLRELAHRAGAAQRIAVDSAGTGDWHIGERADRRALRALAAAGYDGSTHRARVFDPGWFAERELVIALDRGHLRVLQGWAPQAAHRDKLRLLRSFDPAVGTDPAPGELDVADPYYADDAAFAATLRQVEVACRGLLAAILSGRPTGG